MQVKALAGRDKALESVLLNVRPWTGLVAIEPHSLPELQRKRSELFDVGVDLGLEGQDLTVVKDQVCLLIGRHELIRPADITGEIDPPARLSEEKAV